ncbi:hypothetical protein GCWU000325_01533 [Alloprevotella tannerae ATCC 51259]|uniref:Uncharacterized protein n=1 Tax=Alloprevotella tannerae ATCC 51259 TaxID=626522 RepID=C9LH32_9BACT|nr:hypothetical protein GCWU000325_01533 [Alloprevotella tannerae ATCC 51259]
MPHNRARIKTYSSTICSTKHRLRPFLITIKKVCAHDKKGLRS